MIELCVVERVEFHLCFPPFPLVENGGGKTPSLKGGFSTFHFSTHQRGPRIRRFPLSTFPPRGGSVIGVSEKRTHDGQEFVCVAIEPYVRQDGTETELAVWQAGCARCGQPFQIRVPRASPKFVPNRRCPKHHRPGSRV